MDSIPFHHLPPYFFASDLGGMNKLPCSFLKFSNNRMVSSFRSTPFHFISLCSAPFRSLHFMISKDEKKRCKEKEEISVTQISKVFTVKAFFLMLLQCMTHSVNNNQTSISFNFISTITLLVNLQLKRDYKKKGSPYTTILECRTKFKFIKYAFQYK